MKQVYNTIYEINPIHLNYLSDKIPHGNLSRQTKSGHLINYEMGHSQRNVSN